ncbi:MAG: hypothetical protein Q9208_001713 [Pyrenodesmia sp. 3 TL-2023]
MRLFRPHWLILSAVPFAIALISKPPASPSPDEEPHLLKKAIHLDPQPQPQPSPSPNPASSPLLQNILFRLTPKLLQRSPVETPPTAYLPYAPPPNYVWPPGPHTQYPPPSETNAPAGWYGGAPGSTGGQGNSGAGSAQGPVQGGSSSSSSAAPSLRIPFSFFLPNILITFMPSSLLPRPSSPQHRRLRKARNVLKASDPVQTPPAVYLPYPPPPNYVWPPPGLNRQDQNAQPGEFDPPRGWYTGERQGGTGGNTNPNADAGTGGGGAAATSQGVAYPVGGVRYGKSHVALIIMVALISTALVLGGLAYWRGKKGR